MKNGFIHIISGIFLLASQGAVGQVARDSELYRTILELDATYFEAYNTCDLATQASLMSDDLEFYHDQGGLNTSKSEIIQSIEANICGKVTRELVEESLEVHEIAGFGAVEIGYHKFYNNQEPDALSNPSRFITVWKNTEGNWKMHRIISLH
ncbi:nuclear transport factor 2 family protein [Robiginitalea sp.]|jgi:ketosteroid isomerase-like protein|uniref:nuclear transport factor 2 family protein n=1 Tax=Robiginitalea sp. TaxID=1902411 RepID=UPI003C72D1D8